MILLRLWGGGQESYVRTQGAVGRVPLTVFSFLCFLSAALRTRSVAVASQARRRPGRVAAADGMGRLRRQGVPHVPRLLHSRVQVRQRNGAATCRRTQNAERLARGREQACMCGCRGRRKSGFMRLERGEEHQRRELGRNMQAKRRQGDAEERESSGKGARMAGSGPRRRVRRSPWYDLCGDSGVSNTDRAAVGDLGCGSADVVGLGPLLGLTAAREVVVPGVRFCPSCWSRNSLLQCAGIVARLSGSGPEAQHRLHHLGGGAVVAGDEAACAGCRRRG